MFIQNEHGHGVNRLLHGAQAALDEHGISLTVIEPDARPDRRQDLIARLDAGTRGERTYAIELKTQLTSTNARALPPTELPMLLITPYISRESADVLRRNGVDFVDHVGNMSISWPAMLITVVGNRRPSPEHASSRRAPRAFSPAGTKALFAVLSWPDTLGLPLRMIADRAGVSLGTTQIVMNELESSGYLYTVGARRTLANGKELLDRWAEAFTTSLSHKLTLGEFHDHDDRWWRDSRDLLHKNMVQLGGEAGGSLLDSDLTPTTATLYCDSVPVPVVADRRWSRSATEPNVVVRQRFWTPPEPFEALVPSTLIYADMWASGDPRQRAHAERIRAHDNRLVELDGS
ncbi:type IV toxin-antitoxin system AbiEi family antitoxin [Nocardia sp. NPDC051052]|uniref:type IV toxin-antitoxin system AbiEi family antitoxin n=1 Tax=Nocardia sp. NPDC051052 TaxID=3364322 RepID=UPI00379A4504